MSSINTTNTTMAFLGLNKNGANVILVGDNSAQDSTRNILTPVGNIAHNISPKPSNECIDIDIGVSSEGVHKKNVLGEKRSKILKKRRRFQQQQQQQQQYGVDEECRQDKVLVIIFVIHSIDQ